MQLREIEYTRYGEIGRLDNNNEHNNTHKIFSILLYFNPSFQEKKKTLFFFLFTSLMFYWNFKKKTRDRKVKKSHKKIKKKKQNKRGVIKKKINSPVERGNDYGVCRYLYKKGEGGRKGREIGCMKTEGRPTWRRTLSKLRQRMPTLTFGGGTLSGV